MGWASIGCDRDRVPVEPTLWRRSHLAPISLAQRCHPLRGDQPSLSMSQLELVGIQGLVIAVGEAMLSLRLCGRCSGGMGSLRPCWRCRWVVPVRSRSAIVPEPISSELISFVSQKYNLAHHKCQPNETETVLRSSLMSVCMAEWGPYRNACEGCQVRSRPASSLLKMLY